jgi:radical SAM protein with 4Fe4S-binding SPASM domain
MSLRRSSQRKANLSNFVLEVTQECNEDCIYCYNVWKHCRYPKGRLGLGEWKKLITKLKEESRVKLVSISGGEPLLFPELIDLVDFIKMNGISVNLLTNGALIDDKVAGELVKRRISLFEIPLVASTPELHRELKGRDDLDAVMNGMASIFKEKGRITQTFVATKRNILDIQNAVELGIVLGSRGLMFNRINPACKGHLPLMPNKMEIASALEFLNSFSKKNHYPISSSIPIQPCILDMRTYRKISHGFCPSGNERSYYTIDPMGNVRICNHSPTIIGNLLESPLQEIVGSSYVSEFRQVLPEVCKSCGRAEECKGGCKAAAQVCFGSLDRNDPFYEAEHPI